ncbi:hypothetical protein J2744_000969 [Halorubrum trapanicum]|uniref:Uncharacterized protein n=1 Tax=Halorubrum trapanicum TaxID=29284 RepID=A0A8J7R3S3_9EURY|nr:hypothetical protein [Halorubrum trapanicum]MBP1901299.1 hypothetical protein [Halorubrum trapanicum]
MNAVPQTAHNNTKRPAVRERLIHAEVAANDERCFEPLSRFVFESVVDVSVRIAVVRRDPPNQFPPGVLHHVVKRGGRFCAFFGSHA